jgi:hypothetical protein
MEPMSDIPRNQFRKALKMTQAWCTGLMSCRCTRMMKPLNRTTGKSSPSNPYNRIPFPLTLRRQMYRKILRTRILGEMHH